jgi:hypothetical protein
VKNRPLVHKAPVSKAKGRPGYTPFGVMNKTERRYAEVLQNRLFAREIEWWRYEFMTFVLAHDTRYTPDFAVMMKGGVIEFHEVKGFWRDDAKVKIKLAKALSPFIFRTVQWDETKGWLIEEVP